jgi:hypothetical protein
MAAPSGAVHGDGDAVNENDVTKFSIVRGDGHTNVQDVLTKLAGDVAHGDGDTSCQDGVTKVACGAAHGDGDAGCQDAAAKLAAEVMGSDRNPSYLIPDVMVARSVRDWRGVSMGKNVDRGPLPTVEQEGFSLLILAYFISHPLIICPCLARDPYLLKTLLKTHNKLTDNFPR